VSTFCAEHGISRETFYVIRRRAITEGQAAALEPRSRRPLSNPTKITEDVKTQAVAVRAALESSGLDYGPISVYERMNSMGLTPPSVASLARIFRDKGVARAEPKKKPRAAYRRFVYPAPNACWQLDATEYVLTGGRKATIFQLEDDHSRVAVASHVADGETSQAALTVAMKGITARGVPQRLLTDKGLALNPSRRGWEGQLVTYLSSLGVQPITGKPYHPQTQGKNERFHQTLFRWLDKQPLADSIAELQAQVDQFDRIYNTQRPHQGLPGRITPQAAWEATPVATPPRPKPQPPAVIPQQSSTRQSEHTTDGIRTTKVRNDGTIRVRRIEFRIGSQYAGQTAYVIATETTIEFFDYQGTFIAGCPWPLPGTRYVGTKQLNHE
jgi:transposase InsO family protein